METFLDVPWSTTGRAGRGQGAVHINNNLYEFVLI